MYFCKSFFSPPFFQPHFLIFLSFSFLPNSIGTTLHCRQHCSNFSTLLIKTFYSKRQNYNSPDRWVDSGPDSPWGFPTCLGSPGKCMSPALVKHAQRMNIQKWQSITQFRAGYKTAAVPHRALWGWQWWICPPLWQWCPLHLARWCLWWSGGVQCPHAQCCSGGCRWSHAPRGTTWQWCCLCSAHTQRWQPRPRWPPGSAGVGWILVAALLKNAVTWIVQSDSVLTKDNKRKQSMLNNVDI